MHSLGNVIHLPKRRVVTAVSRMLHMRSVVCIIQCQAFYMLLMDAMIDMRVIMVFELYRIRDRALMVW
jgi:hypothetical protein